MMAAQAALEIQRRRRCELEALTKVAAKEKARMELPGPDQGLEKTLLDKPFKRGIRMGR